jgi:hypothetical protein
LQIFEYFIVFWFKPFQKGSVVSDHPRELFELSEALLCGEVISSLEEISESISDAVVVNE